MPHLRLRYPLTRLSAEAARLVGPPARTLRAEGLSAFPLTLTCTALIALFAAIQHTTPGWWLVEHVAGVYQALPLPLILLRLPLSMFAPAPDLPAWGAMIQVLIVFGFSEVHLGRLRTVVTAVCVNGLTTVAARIMVIIGLHLAIGTPQVDQYELDTGPSTVVVALSIYVALRCRAYLVLGITAAAMVGEAVILPNLAGREHLVALALGGLAYFLGERLFPRAAPPATAAATAASTTVAAAITPATPATPVLPTAPVPPASPLPRTPATTTTTTADTPRPHVPDAVPPRPRPRP